MQVLMYKLHILPYFGLLYNFVYLVGLSENPLSFTRLTSVKIYTFALANHASTCSFCFFFNFSFDFFVVVPKYFYKTLVFTGHKLLKFIVSFGRVSTFFC